MGRTLGRVPLTGGDRAEAGVGVGCGGPEAGVADKLARMEGVDAMGLRGSA